MIKLENYSATEIGRLVNEGVYTPTEILDYFIKRIKDRNHLTNAFVYTNFEYAYKKAKELEKRLSEGEYCGVFAGVPFALKDFLPSKKGWTHTYGGVKCLEEVDNESSIFCEAMERAGGIAIGKCNAPAYGFRGTTDNKMFGPTSTPFNLEYNAGGSSGGSAAAVADGLVPIAEGGDAGGSIRVPAACCNLFGFKAGFGSIPNVCRPDAYSATHPFCVNGGLTKTVEDATNLFYLMNHKDTKDPFSGLEIYEDLRDLHKLKIALTFDFDLFEVDSEVVDVVYKAVRVFKKLGISVTLVHFDFKHSLKELSDQWCKGITVDCALDLNHRKAQGKDYLKINAKDFPEEFIYWKDVCDKMGIEDFYQFNLAKTDIYDQFSKVFSEYDIIVSPTMCCLPVKNATDRNTKGPSEINGKPVESLIGWCETFLANFIGYPAASVPAGFSKNGLPVGMQIISDRFKDSLILRLCKEYERLHPWMQDFNRIK